MTQSSQSQRTGAASKPDAIFQPGDSLHTPFYSDLADAAAAQEGEPQGKQQGEQIRKQQGKTRSSGRTWTTRSSRNSGEGISRMPGRNLSGNDWHTK